MALVLRPLIPDLYPLGVFQIPREARVFFVGRERGNDLQINHASVSAQHAKIEVSEELIVDVIDCGSSHGTFVNGMKVEERKQLNAGDLLRFAMAEFLVTADLKTSDQDEDALNGATSPILPSADLLHAAEIVRIRTEISDLNEQVEHGKVSIRDRDSEIAKLSGEAVGQEERVRRLTREIEDLTQREQRNRAQLSETRKTLLDRDGEIAALRYEVTKRDGDLRQLGEQGLQMQMAIDQAITDHKATQAELEVRNAELAASRDAQSVAETTTAGVVERLFHLSERLLADWQSWFQGEPGCGAPLEVDETFTRVEKVAADIRRELDAIEPIWKQFGNGVQDELSRRCDLLREEEAGLLHETEERRVALAEVTENLESLREFVDTEVRRAQGLSRRGTEIEIPERFEAMVIAREPEQKFYRALIERLEYLDRLLEGYRRSRKLREVTRELDDFRAHLAAILEANGVQSYDVPIRTVVTLKHRKEVQILSRKGWGTRQYIEYPFQPGEVTKVVRSGYRVGSGEAAVILRKVEVLIRGLED